MTAAQQQGLVLDGRLSLRVYPPVTTEMQAMGPQLGAHVDGNLFTLLWADQPGLQVLDPATACTADDVMNFGMPSFGPVDATPAITDASFVDTDHTGILFTVGRAWLRSPLTQELGAGGDVMCGVLHRVQLRCPTPRSRSSIPYLVDLHPSHPSSGAAGASEPPTTPSDRL